MSDKRKILYVDDEFINLELFKINFKNDYEVFTCLSAQEGLELLDNTSIDIIVSDLRMPEMNGFEFIKEVKKDYPEKACILLTAYMEPEIMMEAINTKLVYKYLLKPWKKPELQKVIEEAFNIVEVK